MEAPASDLTGLARIRNAALEGFARDGVYATSIRDVAKRAGVSPGLVQHYFPSKTALVEAVNVHVLRLATDAFNDLSGHTTPIEAQQELGDRVTAFVAEHPTALLYVARSTADRDDAALGIFDAFVAIAHAQWQRLADNDLLRPDTDLTWTALHAVVMILGTVLLTDAIERHLPEPFFTPTQLDRWNAASNALFREGTYLQGVPPGDA
ncbi:MAG TPA: helix-turn-helix domain-containing protein [Solirubrobacteraceae bacterium]|nr:helix-turn-helix domain-containing protein [Solirubrobacteraceae bacterium]